MFFIRGKNVYIQHVGGIIVIPIPHVDLILHQEKCPCLMRDGQWIDQ